MTLRLFTCKYCDHKMRFKGDECGRCYSPKKSWQKRIFYITGAFVVAIPVAFFSLAL